MLPLLERTYEAAQAAKVLAREIAAARVTPLTLGVAHTIENDVLDAVLAETGAGLPGFELTLQSGTSEQLIDLGLSGALDLFIVEVPEDAPDRFESWSLFDHIYHMITRAEHPLASGGAVTLDDIRDECWIERALRDAAKAAGFEPVFRHRADGAAQLRRLCVSSMSRPPAASCWPPSRDVAGPLRLPPSCAHRAPAPGIWSLSA
jgi:DNA-binding transcriptional LysR family regulator